MDARREVEVLSGLGQEHRESLTLGGGEPCSERRVQIRDARRGFGDEG